jgi:hypothetical protein
MVETFGYPYLTKGLFTTGSKQHSEQYASAGGGDGDVFIVIPIGNFKYVWSPNVGDQIDISHIVERKPDYSYNEFKQMMDNVQYTENNIAQALKSGHEIILRCGEYIHLTENTLKEWNSDYNSLEELWADLRG